MQVAALILPALALVFAGAFAAMWLADRSRCHVLGFAAGFFVLFLGRAFTVAFPELNIASAIALAHCFSCLGVIAIIWGACIRLGQRIPLVAMLLATAIAAILLYSALIMGKPEVALLVQNGSSGILLGMGAIVLWVARPLGILDRILVWAMLAMCLGGLLRPPILMLMDVDVDAIVRRQAELNALGLFFLSVLTVVLGLCLVAIAMREMIEIRHGTNGADQVSGFYNRQTFDSICIQKVSDARRLALPVSLAVLEIDRLEDFRARWGRDAADMFFQDVSSALRSCLRDGDIAGRIGDGQFGVLLIGMTSDSATKLARDFRQAVESKYPDTKVGTLRFTLSGGIAETRGSETYDRLSRRALISLAEAKKRGVNSVVVDGRGFDETEFEETGSGNFTSFG